MRSLLIASVIGLFVALMAHELGALLIALGLIVVVFGVLLSLTVIGAVVGIPLMLVGAAGTVLGAVSASGVGPALLFGALVGLVVYASLRRREGRAAV